MAKKILIIGSGIAGLSAAEAARKEDSEAEICLLSEEKHLPYYRLRVAEVLANPSQAEELYLHDEDWYKERRIQLRLGCPVCAVKAKEHRVQIDGGEELTYDKLIIASGSRSREAQDIPGYTRENVYTLWNMEDARHFSKEIQECGIEHCVIVGGGVLGMETAWQLQQRGVKVSILERSPHLLHNQLNLEASELLQAYMESIDLEVLTDADTAEVLGQGENGPVEGILLKDGRRLACDAVLFAIGVIANTELVDNEEVAIGRRLKVNQKMESSAPDIYAAGDVCEVGKEAFWFGLWAISMQEGKVAGTNAAGGDAVFPLKTPPYIVNSMNTRIVSQGKLPADKEEGYHFEVAKDEDNYSYKRLVYQGEDLVGFVLLGKAAKEMVKLQKQLVEG